MPTYEYACTQCGEHVEVVQSFSDEPLTTCPSCGGPLRKVFGNIGIVLKGSGFYKTDSRERSGRKKSESSSAGSDSSSSGSESASSSKNGSKDSGSSTPSTEKSAAAASSSGASSGSSGSTGTPATGS